MFGSKISKEDFDQVSSALTEANLLNTRLEAKLEEARTTIEGLNEARTKQAKLLKQHEAEVATLKANHAAELQSVTKQVSRQINNTLSAIGVNTFASEIIYSEKAQRSDQELLKQLNELPQELKTEFYNANKAALSRAILAKS